MKIRYKITLWITLTGVLVSLVFSAIVFFEMLEQPYELLDAELNNEALAVIRQLESIQRGGKKNFSGLELPIDIGRNYIRLYDQRKRVLFRSALARRIQIPMGDHRKRAYTVNTSMPVSQIYLHRSTDDDPADDDELALRMKAFSVTLAGRPAILQIGKPIEKLSEEITDLVWTLVLGLAVATGLLVLLSYGVAGKILQPINTINRLSSKIDDQTLDQRIPLGPSRDELYTLSKSLNRMFDRLQHSFKRQKEFIANASHELKSPLTLLQLSTEDLLQQPELPAQAKEQVRRQLDILRRMSQLIKNLLELSALVLKETVVVERVDLPGVITSVLQDYEPVFTAKAIRLKTDLPPQLEIDADVRKIRRMLVNLLDNAAKYNRANGRIELELAGNAENWRLALANSGPGIPEKDLKRVFQQFYRVEKSRSSQFGGSGLGLAIVKRIVELHGGTVRMQSDSVGWNRVELVFPKHIPAGRVPRTGWKERIQR